MIPLDAAKTIGAVGGTATAVTYTILGDEVSAAGADSFKQLAQGQLAAAAATVYTVPASTIALVKAITLANTTASPVTGIKLFVNGLAAANQITGTITIPANGTAFCNGETLQVFDNTGALIYTVSVTAANVANVPAGNIASTTVQAALNELDTEKQTVVSGVYNVQDYGVNPANSAAANRIAANLLYGTATDGSTILWPANPSPYLVDAACTIPAGKHFRHLGSGMNGKTTVQTTSPTADIFAPGDWYNTFEGFSFQGTYTTVTTGALTLNTTPQTLSIGSNANLAAGAGSGYVSTTTGYALCSWTGSTSTTLTGFVLSAGTATSVAGGPIVFKTAGAAINAGNLVGINQVSCSMQYLFDGYVCAGATANVALIRGNSAFNMIHYSWQINGANWNGMFTENTADCATSSRTVAHLELNQCGSLLMSDNDLIRATNNFDLNATTAYPAGIFGVHSSGDFFDTAGGSCVKFQGIGAIQRVKFVNPWMSSGVNGLEFASTASTLPTAIDLVNPEIYGNSSIGILAPGTGVQDWSTTGHRIAGNTVAGIRTTAAATHKFLINQGTIGPTGGIGANGIGLDIQAGTYGAYAYDGNNCAGNTTTNISDLGTTATTDMKKVGSNLGALIRGVIANLAATVAVPVTTETLVLAARVPGQAVQVGQMFRWNATAILLGANVVTWRARLGSAGTVADAVVADIVVTAAGFLNGRSTYEGELTIRSIGAPGSCEAEGRAMTSTAANAAALAQSTAAAAATSAITTNAVNFIDITMANTVAGATVVQAYIEAM